jgi:hypothetical protein
MAKVMAMNPKKAVVLKNMYLNSTLYRYLMRK